MPPYETELLLKMLNSSFVLRRTLLPGVNALALTVLRTADNKKTEIELIGN